MHVTPLESRLAAALVVEHHYLHRRPPISYAFGLWGDAAKLVGAVTFGTPASRHMLLSACPSAPTCVIELNRLWVHDDCPRNTESWFVARALALLPPRIVLSYADTSHGHVGYIYRALNFNYAGWTDMERKTPRFDYVVAGKHSRQAFRGGVAQFAERVRRRPKVKYWTTTGNRRERRDMAGLCRWPVLSWKTNPPPTEIVTSDTFRGAALGQTSFTV